MAALSTVCVLLLAGGLAEPAPTTAATDGAPTQETEPPPDPQPPKTPTETNTESPVASASVPGPQPQPDDASAAASAPASPAESRAARWRARWSAGLPEGVKARKFLIGVEGVLIQAPPLRPQVIKLDARFLGRTVAMGGLGLFGRYRPVPVLGIEVGVRSGSLRYADGGDDGVVSEDHVLADAGVLLYLARGEIAQFAVDAGVGGAWGRIGYEPAQGDQGTQIFGSGLVRVGADAEFLVKRIAFILSIRTAGVFTDPTRGKSKGSLFQGSSAAVRRIPVPSLQTWLLVSAGIGYRF